MMDKSTVKEMIFYSIQNSLKNKLENMRVII